MASSVTLDAGLRSKLEGLQHQVEVRDEAGQVVGYFVPLLLWREAERYRREVYAWAQKEFTDEEMDRAEQETEECTTAELLRKLVEP